MECPICYGLIYGTEINQKPYNKCINGHYFRIGGNPEQPKSVDESDESEKLNPNPERRGNQTNMVGFHDCEILRQEINDWKHSKGHSQAELARQAKISPTWLSEFLLGSRERMKQNNYNRIKEAIKQGG